MEDATVIRDRSGDRTRAIKEQIARVGKRGGDTKHLKALLKGDTGEIEIDMPVPPASGPEPGTVAAVAEPHRTEPESEPEAETAVVSPVPEEAHEPPPRPQPRPGPGGKRTSSR
jgi:hypothetical protein